MNNVQYLCSASVAAFMMLYATTAHAQTLPEIGRSVTEGAQIEKVLDNAESRRQQVAKEEEAIDGEAGVYILKKADIFYVAGSAGVGYSSNPLRTVDDLGGSGVDEASLSLGVQTLIAEKFDFSASASFESTRFFEKFAPSNNVASGSIGIGTGIGNTPFYASVSGFGGWNFDKDVKNPSAFYGASAQLSAQFPLGKRVVIQPQLVASRVYSQVEENNLTSLGGRVAVATKLGKFSVSASVAATRFWYDDFYEDVTFVPRRDWQYDASLSVAHPIGKKATIAASVRYAKRDSSFFLSNYDSFDGSAALVFRWRF